MTNAHAAAPDLFGDEVRELLSDVLQIPLERIDMHTELADLPGVDSLGLILVNIALEEHYGTVMPDPGTVPLRRIADLVATLRAHLPSEPMR